MGTGGHNVPLIKDGLGIRKLTPRECLNFQGFPKSFKFPDDMPVSQRYKQAGNAVTITLIAKIAKIISKSFLLYIGEPSNNTIDAFDARTLTNQFHIIHPQVVK